ncbi:hypothetical protein BDV28DRAFT_161781 [Aspergillus coremiiformis]|uniref:HNH nuclease domain-containing protein n=1 Tax=Aspergillus coremiiformis TaxID=138285 RepID=A0A5N6ZHC0_9EURO|nr:hypothetical protein BDV28DRAFT_161781 [Aspergillus coremiiformis]
MPLPTEYKPTATNDETRRLLHSFFKYLSADGKSNLADDVLGCETDLKLRQLVKNLETGLLFPMKALGGKSVKITQSPRLGVEDSIENFLSMDLESASRNQQKKIRDECLLRENNRCMLTGAYDKENHPPGSAFGPLQATHIIPFSLRAFENDAGRVRSCVIWTNIYRYFPAIRSRLNFTAEDIKNHENAMMLLEPLRGEFGAFHLSFAATTTPNLYQVKTFPEFSSIFSSFLPANRLITFVSHDVRYQLPHPVLLEIHNAIAHILHATGRTEVIEKLQREYEERKCLATGGATDVEMLLAVSSLSLLESADKRNNHKRRPQGGSQETKGKQRAQSSDTEATWKENEHP